MGTAEEAFMDETRRSFFRALLPGAALICLGGPCLLRATQAENKAKAAGPKHKFLNDSGMTFTEFFVVAYAAQVPIWRGLELELGRDRAHELMKRAIDRPAKEQMTEFAKKAGKNDLAAYTRDLHSPSRFWQNVLTYEVIEDTLQAFEIRVTECLWAKTYRDAHAGDLGYILSCHADFAAAKAFNPKMRLVRTKTLMQGHDSCNNRYVLEG
jgi:hypothetical protein